MMRWRDAPAEWHNKQVRVWTKEPGVPHFSLEGKLIRETNDVLPLLIVHHELHSFAWWYNVELIP